uniref:Putative monolaris n=1 Tax=Rhipicephalus pulchellus TaxID=72859 RepID=L7LPN9_RHIPC
MRLLQYSILACLLICIIADFGHDKSEEALALRRKRIKGPTPTGRPPRRWPPVEKNQEEEKRLRQRCTFKLDQINCAGAFFVQRWAYDSDSDTCESVNFPVCWNKAGVFLTCSVCMKTCTKRNKKDPTTIQWIRKFCEKSMKKHLKKHSLS